MNLPVASPCIRHCCLDDNDICLGCFRSMAEIMAWGGASEADRRAIISRAKQRRSLEKSADFPTTSAGNPL